MSHLAGILIVLGLVVAFITGWPWSLLALAAGALLVAWLRRPLPGNGTSGKMPTVNQKNRER